MRAFRVISVSLVVLTLGMLVYRYRGDFKWPTPWRWLGQGSNGVPAPGEAGPVIRLNPFLVTEWEGDTERFVTVTFDLELNDERGRDTVIARNSRIRSEILSLLADLQLSSLGDSVDYQALKTQVQKRIQRVMPEDPIRHVFITQFIIQ